MSDPTEAFIDWENTNATVHFYCACGAAGKLETQKGNHVQCAGCMKVFRFGGMISVNRVFVEPGEVQAHEEEWELPLVEPGHGIHERIVRPPTDPDCDCCSCVRDHDSDKGWNVDPYCRFHGWAGTRPCTEHGSPGLKDQTNRMPRSVQDARTSHRTSV